MKSPFGSGNRLRKRAVVNGHCASRRLRYRPRRRGLSPGEHRPQKRRRRCAFLDGFSLHADTRVHQNDRESLERSCRYGARGPLALERLSRREDGKLEYRLKKAPHGGATTLVMTAMQLLKRLGALVVANGISANAKNGRNVPCEELKSAVDGSWAALRRFLWPSAVDHPEASDA